jgi:hypothetical protein
MFSKSPRLLRIYFRADAAFTMPGVYECLEAERVKYAIRRGLMRLGQPSYGKQILCCNAPRVTLRFAVGKAPRIGCNFPQRRTTNDGCDERISSDWSSDHVP